MGILLLLFLYYVFFPFAVDKIYSVFCIEEVRSEKKSGHENYATHYTGNCGATAGFDEVVKVGGSPRNGKVVFSAEIPGPRTPVLELDWLTPNRLLISIATSSIGKIGDIEIFKSKREMNMFLNGSVTIEYDKIIEDAIKASSD